jgi:hypothetical protein
VSAGALAARQAVASAHPVARVVPAAVPAVVQVGLAARVLRLDVLEAVPAAAAGGPRSSEGAAAGDAATVRSSSPSSC